MVYKCRYSALGLNLHLLELSNHQQRFSKEPTTYPLNFYKMGRSSQYSDSTANVKAGYHGLWKLGRRMNLMALSWKLMEDLRKKELGVWEVECAAWTRSMNRRVKKGLDRPAFAKGWYGNGLQRDRKFIK